MFKKFIATAAALLLGIGLSVIAVAAPASAHTGDVKATAVCNTQTGKFDVTYKLTTANVPANLTGIVKTHKGTNAFANGWGEGTFTWEGGEHAIAPNGSYTWFDSLPGTTVNGPWVYTFTRWSNGVTVKSDTRVEGLDGNCAIVYDATASVSVTQATCDSAATLVLGSATHAAWGAVTGSYSVTATADENHFFAADASAGVTVSPDGKTKTFTGTLDPKKNPYSEDCGDEAFPVKPDVVEVSKCGVYGSVTPKTTTGVDYVVDFNPATGAYTVTATPKTDFFFAGGAADQVKVFTGNVGAFFDCVDTKVTLDAVGECVYDAEANPADRTATITYDNTGSTKAILFSGIPGHDQSVPAGQKVTFDITVGPNGADFTVTADGKTFPVVIGACPEYSEPDEKVEHDSVETMICSPDNQVEISTTTTTTSYVFNPGTKTWDAQTPVVTGPVITYRPMTDEEKDEECGFTIDTDPKASQCDVVDGGTQLTSWIYVSPDPRAIYTITNDITKVVISPASGYVSVVAGKYSVTAVAAPGFVLNPSTPKTWPPFFVQDTTKCENPDLGLLTPTATPTQPTCTSAASYTLGGLEGAQFNWTINGAGTTVPNGTYAGPSDGSDVVLVATPVDPDDRLQDWTNPTVLKFQKAPTAAMCDELTTLAFTGSGPSLPLALVAVLLGLGGAGFVAAGRRLREQQ